MAQHDYVIANGTGAAVRSDLNNALAAIVSQNSGATEPATTYAFQFWADTTTNLLKLRNSANNAWVTLFQLDGEWSTLPVENGTAAAPSIYFKDSGTDTGFYSPGTDQVAISTGGTGRLFINSSGSVGIGASTVDELLHLKAGAPKLKIEGTNASTDEVGIHFAANQNNWFIRADNFTSQNLFSIKSGTPASSTHRFVIDSSGRCGIGTTSPSGANLVIDTESNSGSGIRLIGKSANDGSEIDFYADNNSTRLGYIEYNNTSTTLNSETNVPVRFFQNGGEAFRVDTSKRLLVGTSSARTGYSGNTPEVQIEAAKASDSVRFGLCNNSNGVQDSQILLAKTRGTSVGSNTVVQDGDTLGRIQFLGADGTDLEAAAQILAQVDGTPGNNDMPGRLVFSVTSDGASSPTERMRITNGGQLWVSTTTGVNISSSTDTGFTIEANGTTLISRSANIALSVNRQTDDGAIVSIRQAGTEEGSISVSGTTVSYNGAHLSRWSQLPGGAERSEILRGTVLSNIDEMCEWTNEENEQLNRMKVSDVESDKNVSGVFQAWDDDDDTYTNDFYCAMTGDFIIRIAQGVTVERGDLLMSAGDGTAKPQDDDIIRSKTIAKVTSTNVTCTYEDGSYCVPCVLMAC